jgi:hypothetical protein
MKRMGWVVIAVAVAIGGAASPATATSFKRCGSAGTMYDGQLRLTNVQAKRTTCKKARRFARAFTRKSGGETGYRCSEDFYCTWRGWQCRNDGRDPGVLKHRCETINVTTHRVMVVKWVDRPAG